LNIGCLKHVDLVNACEAKLHLTNELEAKLKDWMEHEKNLEVSDMNYLPQY
jgi:hypothetical protein